MTDEAALCREQGIAKLMEEHWPFSGGFTVSHVIFPDPVVEIEYDGGSFIVDGRGGIWGIEEHIIDNLPHQFLRDVKPLSAQGETQ